MTARGVLLRLVRRLRRRSLLQGVARVVLAGVSGFGLGPLASAAVLPWVPAAVRARVALGSLALGAAAGVTLGVLAWKRARPLLSRAQAARLLASLRPELANLVQTGADLAAWGEGGAEARGASPELAEAQVDEAARVTGALDAGEALPLRRVLPWAAGAAGVGIALTVVALWNPGGSANAWRSLFAEKPPQPVSVGNLKIRYEPPAYTGLSASAFEGVSGAVEGLRGTRVTLEGALSASVEAGRWEGSDGQVVALQVRGKTFSVPWILDRAGAYTLSFQRGGKRVPSDFRSQPIVLKPDERPRVEMKAPEGDVEIRSDGELEVQFSAVDDFRVDRVELVLQGSEQTPTRIPVRMTPGRSAEGAARFTPLAYPKLGAGVHLRVEAWDSDTVSGPKAGASRSVYVTILDKKKLMGDIEGLGERLFEALLTHLADHLEAPAPRPDDLERLRGKASDLLHLFESLVAKVRQGGGEEALGVAAILKMEDGLRAALGPFVAGAGGSREGLIAELERDVLFLDRLLRNLQMEETLSMGDELSALQRGLFDDLQAGASPKDLVSRIDQIQKLLNQMMDRLRRGSGEVPDAFANADAVKNMPSSELQDTLQKLRKALEAGKKEEARKLAEKLLETLSRWMKALEDAAESAAGQEMDPVMKDLSKLEAEVEDLMGDQEQVLQETRSVADEASRKAGDALKGDLRSFQERQEQRLAVIAELARRIEALSPRGFFHPGAPPPFSVSPGRPMTQEADQPPPPPNPPDLFELSRRVSSAISELRQALRNDLGRARGGAEDVREALKGLRNGAVGALDPGDLRRQTADRHEQAAEREIEGLLADLDALDRRRQRALGPREAQALRGLKQEEGTLEERAGAVAERLQELSRQTPFVGAGTPRKARSSKAAMGEAGEKLGQGNPFGAVPPEGRAMEELADLAKELGNARRQMLKGKGSGGFPMVRSPGRGTQEGGREVDRSHVEIPKEAETRELKAFREEVLKAMRRGEYPKNYEDEVERYYERLIK